MTIIGERSAEYHRGYEDAIAGAGPDYSQATTEGLLAYWDGYKAGRRERLDVPKCETCDATGTCLGHVDKVCPLMGVERCYNCPTCPDCHGTRIADPAEPPTRAHTPREV